MKGHCLQHRRYCALPLPDLHSAPRHRIFLPEWPQPEKLVPEWYLIPLSPLVHPTVEVGLHALCPVLALPELVGQVTRPFISAYWAWAGSIESLDNRYQAAVKTVTETPLDSTSTICLYVLSIQILVGIIASYIGIKRHQWEH